VVVLGCVVSICFVELSFIFVIYILLLIVLFSWSARLHPVTEMAETGVGQQREAGKVRGRKRKGIGLHRR